MRQAISGVKMDRLCRSVKAKRAIFRLATAVTLMAATLWLAGCQVDPVTGRKTFNTLGPGQALALGEQAAPQYVEAFGGQVDDPALREYVSQLGQKIAGVSHTPDLPWQFYLLDSSMVNAFAVPGGHVFVTRGLMSLFDSEAELAAVLAHEVTHVVRGHSGQQLARAQALQLGLAIGGAASGAEGQELQRIYNIGGQVGTLAFLLPFSREHEDQADATGVLYLVRAGYEPAAMVRVLEILEAQSRKTGRAPLIFSTHPYPEQRAQTIRQLIQSRYSGPDVPHELGQDRYQREALDRLAKLPQARHHAQ